MRTGLLCVFFSAMACLISCDDTGGGSARRNEREDIFEQTRREILELQKQPVAQGHVKVRIRRLETRAQQRSGLGIAGVIQSGTPVQLGSMGGRNGFVLVRTTDKKIEAALLGGGSQQSVSRTEQFLVLLPGSIGSVEAVKVRPIVYTIAFPIYYGVEIIQVIEKRVSGSAFHVHILSASADAVELELIPYFHGTDRGSHVEVEHLRTRVQLRPGVPYVLAANQNARESAALSFFGSMRETIEQELAIVLTLEVGF